MSNIFSHFGTLPGGVKQYQTPNLGELWESWRQSQREADRHAAEHGIYTQGGPVINEKAMNNYFENKLYEHETKS